MTGSIVERMVRDAQPALQAPGHRALLDYWRSKIANGSLPSRADIDPADVPRDILSSIYLVTVERRPGRPEPTYTYRLVGTNVVWTAGRDVTGLTLEEAYPRPADLAAQRRAYECVVMAGEPYGDRYPMRIPGKEHIMVSRLLLPLAADGSTVDMILGMSVYGSWSDRD